MSLSLQKKKARSNGDALGGQTQVVCPPSDSSGFRGEDEDAEDETRTAISDWLTRVCPTAGKREKRTSEAVAEGASGEIRSEADSVRPLPAVEYPEDRALPVRRQTYARETDDKVRAMRDGATSDARRSLDRQSCQNLFSLFGTGHLT